MHTNIIDFKVPVDIMERYQKTTVPMLVKKYAFGKMSIPYVEKIVVTSTFSRNTGDKNYAAFVADSMTKVVAQKCVITKARTSVSSFKVREGMNIGVKVTLRRRVMYDFLNRLVYITLPRVRDFKGFSKSSFDTNFNFNIGIADASCFHEIDTLMSGKTFGVNISFSIKNVKSREQALDLLQSLIIPVK